MPSTSMPFTSMRRTRLVVAAGLALLLAAPAFAGDIIVMKSGRKYGNPKSNVPPSEEDYAASNITIVEESLDKAMSKCGLAPKIPFKDRLAKGWGTAKELARASKAMGACLPAAARIAAYLYNPFRKEPNPKKEAQEAVGKDA